MSKCSIRQEDITILFLDAMNNSVHIKQNQTKKKKNQKKTDKTMMKNK